MKDNFSKQADLYARFRPKYPQELIDFVISQVPLKHTAWDCGTGNGQFASRLADYFGQVKATDISATQLQHAEQKPNIDYRVLPAEQTDFDDDSFDLVTVAQAIHWFNFDTFYAEVRRTLKPGGIFAAVGYGPFESDAETNAVIHHFYSEVVGPYWDPERRYIDEHYLTIPFPFEEIAGPNLSMVYEWDLEQLTGYLNTWSAVQHYQNDKGTNPVTEFADTLAAAWGDVKRSVKFPILLRIGKNTDLGS